ncbi:MAG: GDSL-type esterase/lipase family protein [Planctomycetota bacterium]|nr:GDSL-type esterase/lipase family protein [Planctomycetota bacterium]
MRFFTSAVVALAVVGFSLLETCAADLKQVDLLIVAGQSNAVGADTDPGEMLTSEADQHIMFWWKCGDPPPDEHDSTSGGKWTHLQAQPLGNPKKPRQDRQYGNFAHPDGGFGPEINFARTLYARENKPLAMIKVAFSGTGLRRDWDHTDSGEAGACYRSLISETRAAIQAAKKSGIELRPRAFGWVQGESDANANDSAIYARNLDAMLTAIRRELDAPKLAALIAVNTKFLEGRNQFMPAIIEQQKLVASFDPRWEYVDTSAATIANQVHYDSKGTLEVGRLFAESLLRIEKSTQPERRHLTIVTLGDSITKGVRSGVSNEQTFASLIEQQLAADGRSVDVINVGIGGERTDQALQRLDRVLRHQPDIVTIMYGTNDSYVDQGKTASRISVDDYRANLNKIVAELLSRKIQPVLMTEPRWSDKARQNGIGENPNIKLEPFVQACRDVAKEWRVPLIDHFADWTTAHDAGSDLHAWTTDGCHPNVDGHVRLTQTMLPVLKSTIGSALKIRKTLLSGDPVKVVCFGDSVTGVYYHSGSHRAYTDMLGIALQRVSGVPNVEMINAGISGHTTVNALARIDRDVLAHNPDVVTVMFGLNDMTRVSLDDYRANLKTIVEKCRSVGAEVVLATPNNVIDTPSRPTNKLIMYCDVVREVGRETGVSICDTYQQLDGIRAIEPFGWRLMMSDAIHPNMAGHKSMAERLAQTITGAQVSLANEPPSLPALQRTLARIKDNQPVRVLAMAPYDSIIKSALQNVSNEVQVDLTPWPVEGLSLAQIEQDAKALVRASKPDLVLIAIPQSAVAESDETFASSYAWTMNWSLNFGPPTWDCVVIHPSVADTTANLRPRDDLVRQLVAAQDLHLVDRKTGDVAEPVKLIEAWLTDELKGSVATE